MQTDTNLVRFPRGNRSRFANVTAIHSARGPANFTAPLKADEMVPDATLRFLALDEPCRDQGELSEEHQSLLAMYLPEICGELLALRALHRKGDL